jgi:hypothetical protein
LTSTPPEKFLERTRLVQSAAEDLRRSTSAQELRTALCRYLRRGAIAGFSTGELVDFLGVSSPSVLDQAGYTEQQAEEAMRVLAAISEEEISSAEMCAGADSWLQ